MKVLVTGGGGFIGSAICRALAGGGDEVHIFQRTRPDPERFGGEAVTTHIGDLLEPRGVRNLFSTLRPDVVIHAAWYAVPGKYPSAPENRPFVDATEHLVKTAAEHGVKRFLGVGTCFEYAFRDEPLDEGTSTDPSTLYAESKLKAGAAAGRSAKKYGVSFAWLRLFYQYGPFEDERRLVSSITLHLLRGEPAPTSHGTQIRDFLHIDDVGEAVRAVMNSELGGIVNIGSGEPVKVRAIVEKLGELTGRPNLPEFGAYPPRPDDPPAVVADISKLQRATGWTPRYTLHSGLEATVDWWRTKLRS